MAEKKKYKRERKKALVSTRITLNALQSFHEASPGKHPPGEVKTGGKHHTNAEGHRAGHSLSIPRLRTTSGKSGRGRGCCARGTTPRGPIILTADPCPMAVPGLTTPQAFDCCTLSCLIRQLKMIYKWPSQYYWGSGRECSMCCSIKNACPSTASFAAAFNTNTGLLLSFPPCRPPELLYYSSPF